MKHPIESSKQLGELIRRTRKAQGVRQDDLAGIVGASHVFLRELEHGKSTVQLGKVLGVLRELGIHLIVDVPDATTTATPSAPTERAARKRKPRSNE